MEQARQPSIIKGNPRSCVFLFAGAVGLVLASERWFFPWLRDFSAHAHCEEIFGFNGSVVLFAALFIGVTFSALVIAAWLAFTSLKILKSGQMPPPGAFVCRDTVPKTGRFVRCRAYIGLSLPFAGVAFLGWGILTFSDLKENLLDPAIERTKKTCMEKDNRLPGASVPHAVPGRVQSRRRTIFGEGGSY